MLEDYEQEINRLSVSRIDLSNKYATERKAYGEAKAEIDILLTGYIIEMQEKVKSIGYERSLLTLVAMKPEMKETYRATIKHFNNYKAIERMIDAHDSRIMAIQSIMRFNRTNDGGH